MKFDLSPYENLVSSCWEIADYISEPTEPVRELVLRLLKSGEYADLVPDITAFGAAWDAHHASKRRGGRARMTPAEVLDLRVRYLGGESKRSIANSFGVDRSTVYYHLKPKKGDF